MSALSIVGKELLSRMRSWRAPFVASIHLVTLLAIAVGYSFGAQSLESRPVVLVPGPLEGPQLFDALTSFELLLIVFLTPALTATAINGERERRTFDLLLLTRLSGFGIVAGKLLGTLCFLLVLIVSSLPVFGLVFLFGGVTLNVLAPVYLLYAAVATALASLGVCASALTRRAQTSAVVSYATALALIFGTTIAASVLATPTQPRPGSALAIPAAAWLVAAANPLVAMLSVLPNPTGFGVIPSVPLLPVPAFLTLNAAPPTLGGIWSGPPWQLHLEYEAIAAVVLVLVAAVAVRPPRLRRVRRPRMPRPVGDTASSERPPAANQQAEGSVAAR